MKLTKKEREELSALAHINDVLKGPSFMWRPNWHGMYKRLVRGGYVHWGDPPAGFDKRDFAGTTVTKKGRAEIA